MGAARGGLQGECRGERQRSCFSDLRFQSAFTDANFQLFFTMTVEVLVRPWEKMVQGMQFSEVSFTAAGGACPI